MGARQCLWYVAENVWSFEGYLSAHLRNGKLNNCVCACKLCGCVPVKQIAVAGTPEMCLCWSYYETWVNNQHVLSSIVQVMSYLFNFPSKLRISKLRNGSFAAGAASRRWGAFFYLLSNSASVYASLEFSIFLYTSRKWSWLFVLAWNLMKTLLKIYHSLTCCFTVCDIGIFVECLWIVKCWRCKTSISLKWLQSSMYHTDHWMGWLLACL